LLHLLDNTYNDVSDISLQIFPIQTHLILKQIKNSCIIIIISQIIPWATERLGSLTEATQSELPII
jgi:hypothetical protein